MTRENNELLQCDMENNEENENIQSRSARNETFTNKAIEKKKRKRY